MTRKLTPEQIRALARRSGKSRLANLTLAQFAREHLGIPLREDQAQLLDFIERHPGPLSLAVLPRRRAPRDPSA